MGLLSWESGQDQPAETPDGDGAADSAEQYGDGAADSAKPPADEATKAARVEAIELIEDFRARGISGSAIEQALIEFRPSGDSRPADG